MYTDYSKISFIKDLKENIPITVIAIFFYLYSLVSSAIIAFHKIQTLPKGIQAWFILNFVLLILGLITIISFELDDSVLPVMPFGLWYASTFSIYFWFRNSNDKILKMKAHLALSNFCVVLVCFIVSFIVFQYQDSKFKKKRIDEILQNRKLKENIPPHAVETSYPTSVYQTVVTSDPTSVQQAEGLQKEIVQDPSSTIAPIEDFDTALAVVELCSSDESNAAKLKRDPFVCSQPLIAFYLRDSLNFQDKDGNNVVKDYAEFTDDDKNEIKLLVLRKIWNAFNNKNSTPILKTIQDKSQKYLSHKIDFIDEIKKYTEKISDNILLRTTSTDEFQTSLRILDHFKYTLPN